ncbi:nitrate- and nitrite sensing domain-containing protein [Streptomyces clavuligerus]|uniref:nitrate- and nitrite sensing domain-containing protein n=1 Tax=Streptomyces clavuligerus TaxID=1901 RepID=UPI003F68582A
MQGRFKRDGAGSPPTRQSRGEAVAGQEPRGGTDRGPSPQHTRNQGPAGPGADGGDRGARSGPAPLPGGPRSAAARAGVTVPGMAGPPPGPGVPGGPGGPGGAGGPGGPGGGPVPAGDNSPSAPKGTGPVDTGSRLALRNWRISTRLISLLTLPVVAATALGGLRINESMERMEQLDHMQLLTDMTQEATKLAVALQEERDETAGPLSNKVKKTDFKITEPRESTDRARKSFLETTRDIPNTGDNDALESIRANANQIARQLAELNTLRKNAYADNLPKSLTVEKYHRLIQSLLGLSQDMAQATSNPEMIKRTRALAAFSSAKEYASMQRGIIAAALPGGAGAEGPGLSDTDREYGEAALQNGEDELEQFEQIYAASGGDPQDLTEQLDNGNPIIGEAQEYAQRVLSRADALEDRQQRSYLDWIDDYGVRIEAMKQIETTLLGEMETKARQLREESQREAIINGALIVVVLGVSLVGAFVVARSMIRSLRRLQDTATKVAQERLPELVKQLSESDPQDVDTSVESVGVHSRDEIGKVAAAFDDVHREAVRLAAEQALLRGNVNAMFTNLSRRSQGLIQRQLSLISELESREADPDQLSSLFKLDHLATRMRRNGENLLVLAGEEPGRRWTRPVPLVDVLRAAASEVEQYERIELAAVPATQVAGRVVNDLVHLLAELLENATSFSSPQTKVKVTGHALPDGRVLVEIHDTGIGLSPEDLAAINERLASPPTVDVSVSRRMGLFVVGRLSLRHGIRIQLRPSDSGGTTALVMLPVDLAQGGRKAPGAPGAGVPGGMPPGGPGGGLGGPGGLGGGPGGPGGPGAPVAGGPQRGQVGAGPGGPGGRTALPSRDGGPGQGRQGTGLAGAFGNRPPKNGSGRGTGPQQGGPGGPNAGDRGRQLPTPAAGGPRPELPGGPGAPQRGPNQAPGPFGGPAADAPRGHEENGGLRGPGGSPQQGGPGGPFVRPDVFGSPQQGPVGGRAGGNPPGGPFASRNPGAEQDPTATAPMPRIDPGAPRPAGMGQDPAATGQFPRPDFQDPASGNLPRPGYQDQNSGQLPQPGYQDPATTGSYTRPGYPGQDTGQNSLPGYPGQTDTGQFPRPDLGAPQPPAPGQAPAPRGFEQPGNALDGHRPAALPDRPQPEALPPAPPGPVDGRTPLYDTLETDWFRSQEQGSGASGQDVHAERPVQQDQPEAGWHDSPNDELGRQAERARKPSSGGVTTSGLPRRVPRANLVAGTAQEQSAHSGPQVSRAPDDVRGRLTNLRRGIQQGRQQNSSTTDSFNLGPTHPQER